MAQITFTIPDAVVPRILSAFTAVRPLGVPEGETPNQTFRASIIAFVKRVVAQYEAETAVTTARVNALNDVYSSISIT